MQINPWSNHGTAALDVQTLERLLMLARANNSVISRRLEWVLDYARGNSVTGTCRRFGIARTTLYRWLKRFSQAPEFTGPPQQSAGVMPLGPNSVNPSCLPPSKGLASGGCPCCTLRARLAALRPGWGRRLLAASIVLNLLFVGLALFAGLYKGQPSSAKTPGPVTNFPGYEQQSNTPTSPSLIHTLLGIDIAQAATGIYRPINYQGKLTNSGGVAIANGNYDMRFKIFSAASGGNPDWSETWDNTTQRVTATGGLFSIALGTHAAMTGSVNFNSDSLFLQIEFDPGNDGTYEEVFSPRRRFASVPYAHNASSFDGLDSTQFIRSDTSSTASGTLTISPRDATKMGIDILSTAGNAATGALRLSTQGANHIIFGSGGVTANYDTNLYRASANILKTDDSFHVAGTLSGKTLVVSGNASLTGSLVVRRTISGATLEILGTASGQNLFATRSISGTYLYAASTFGGAGLASCSNATTSKLLYNSATKQFSCGTDQTGGGGLFGSGNVLALGDARYVKKQGDTMTGVLILTPSGGVTAQALRVLGTQALTGSALLMAGSSTTKPLVVKGAASQSANLQEWQNSSGVALLAVAANGQVVSPTDGIGAQFGRYEFNGPTYPGLLSSPGNNFVIYAPGPYKTQIETGGADVEIGSFASPKVNIYGKLAVGGNAATAQAQITSGSAGTPGIIVRGAPSQSANLQEWQNSAGTVLAGIDKSGSGFLAALGVGTPSPKARLDVVGTISGKTLVVSGNGSFSGSLVVNRTISGAALEVLGTASGVNLFATQSVTGTNLFAVSTFNGAGLTDCSTAGTSKLLWSAATKRFSCGTDQSGSSGISLSVADERYVKKQGDTVTGALTINLTSGSLGLKIIQTASGNIIHAERTLTSSGTIVAVGSITTRNTLSGKTLVVSGNASVTGSLVVAKGISGATLEILGTASGQNLFATRSISGTHLYAATTFGGAGLASCSNGTTSKLLYNSATKQFSCGTDQSGSANTPEVGTSSFSGSVLVLGDARYVKKQGDTMTGALTINLAAGTIGLNVLSAMSGNTLVVSKGAFFAGSGVSITSSGQTVFNEQSRNVDFRIESDGDANAFFVDASTNFVGIGKNIPKAKLDVQGTASGSALTVSGLANCNTNNTVKADAQGNLFCATDEGGGGSSSKWTDAGVVTYLTATADDLAVGGSDTSAPLYFNTAGKRLEVLNISGGTLRAQDLLTSSGTLSVEGATILQSTLSVAGNATFDTNTLFVDAAVNRVGIGTATPQSELEVAGTISGTTLHILGTASGQNLFATRSISGTHLYAATTFGGAGLDSCSNGTTSKLLYNSATKQFSCGTDQNSIEVGTSSFSGATLRLGDARYVKKQGDTMTGALTINLAAGTIGLNVLSAMSGNTLVVSKGAFLAGSGVSITSSGSTVFNEQSRNVDFRIEGDTNANVFFLDASTDRIGIGTNTPKATLDVAGTLSGKTLTISGNASITGSLVVNKNISGAALEILGTASGMDLFATRSVSGTHLYAASTFGGAGLTSCSNGTTSKLLYNSATKQFSCGTDQTGGGGSAPEVGTASFSGATLRLGDARYVKKQGDTMTGALVIDMTSGNGNTLGLRIINTASGRHLHAEQRLTSSGALIWEGAGSGRSLDLGGGNITFSLSGQTVFNALNRNVDFSIRSQTNNSAFFLDASTSRVGIGTNTLESAFEVVGSISGTTLIATGTGSKPLFFASAPWNSVGIGTATPAQRLTVSGGSILNLAGGAIKPLSGINLGGDGKGVAVVGSYAYVVGGGSGQPELRIIDISNKLQPAVVGQLEMTSLGGLNAVAVAGRYAYTVGNNGAGDLGLRIVEVTNPSAPLPVSTLSLGNATETSLAVAVSGNFAYVGKSTSFSSGTLYIIDVSNAFAPRVVGLQSAGASVDISSVAVSGRYAYLGTGDDGDANNEFQVLDVGNPSAPVVVGGLNLDATVNTIAVAGRYAYLGLTSNGGAELRVFDVSNPGGPTSVGGLELGTDGVKSVAVTGEYAYVGTTNASGTNSFKVVDVSSASAPAVVGAYGAGSSVNALAVAGKYGYVGLDSVSGNDFVVLDLNGIDAPAATIGSLGVNVLHVSDSVSIQNLLNVVNGITVGQGGIHSEGALTVLVGSGAVSGSATGALILNRSNNGVVLALDSHRNNGTGSTKLVPHVLFGYRGQFDTNLYRAGTGILATDSTLLVRGGTGRTLLKLESASVTQGESLIEAFSDNGLVGGGRHNRVFRVTAGGDAFADGTFTGGGADYAERFLASTANLKPGQAVCLDPLKSNTVKLCDRSGDPNVMGIISTKPAFVGDKYRGVEADGKSDATSAIVGLIGQLPAKAIVEDGLAIAVGDALATAAKPGYVRKAKAGESTVGVALSPLLSGEGSIDVLITRRNQSDLVEKIENEVTQSIADMHIEDDVRTMVQTAMNGANINGAVSAAVQAQVQSLNLAAEVNAILNQRLADGSLNIGSSGTLSTDIYAALQSHSGSLSVQNAVAERLGITRSGTSALMTSSDLLVAGAVTVQQDVKIGGTLHAAAIQGPIRFDGPILPGTDFAIGAIRMTGSTVQIGSLTDSGALQVMGNVTIAGLTTFLGGVEVKGELIVSSNQAGFAVIPAHTKAVSVTFGTGFISTPVINATPNGRVGSEWWIDSQTQTGFVIRTDKSVAQDVRFSWTALGVRDAHTSSGQAGAASLIPFHTDVDGRPYSLADNVWNACIRDPNSLDACRGYHQGSQWFFHPDIVQANQTVLAFTYDASAGPSSLVLPDSYEATAVEQVTSSSSSAAVSSAVASSEAPSVSSGASPSLSPPAEPAGEQQPGEPPLTGDATGPANPGPAPEADTSGLPISPSSAEGGAQQ